MGGQARNRHRQDARDGDGDRLVGAEQGGEQAGHALRRRVPRRVPEPDGEGAAARDRRAAAEPSAERLPQLQPHPRELVRPLRPGAGARPQLAPARRGHRSEAERPQAGTGERRRLLQARAARAGHEAADHGPERRGPSRLAPAGRGQAHRRGAQGGRGGDDLDPGPRADSPRPRDPALPRLLGDADVSGRDQGEGVAAVRVDRLRLRAGRCDRVGPREDPAHPDRRQLRPRRAEVPEPLGAREVAPAEARRGRRGGPPADRLPERGRSGRSSSSPASGRTPTRHTGRRVGRSRR